MSCRLNQLLSDGRPQGLTIYLKNGQIHRENGPAVTQQFGNIRKEMWCLQNKLHRNNNEPAYICNIHQPSSSTFKYKWYRNGHLHRSNGPAVLNQLLKDGQMYEKRMWFNNGTILKEEHTKNNRLHKDKGPALAIYNGRQNKRLIWYQNGTLHRLNGPAYIETKNNKREKIRCFKQIWYNRGKVHREDGPALSWSSVRYRMQQGGVQRHNVDIWCQNNRYHRQQCRFHSIVNKNGERLEEWYPDEQWSQNEPAIIESLNGVPFFQEWYISGELKRRLSRLYVSDFPSPVFSKLLKLQ